MQQGNNISHYTVLDVSEDASPAQLKAAYRAAVLKHHPDRGTEKSSDKFFRVQQAYEVKR